MIDFDAEIRTRQEAVAELKDRIHNGGCRMIDGRKSGERYRLPSEAVSRARQTIASLWTEIDNLKLRKEAREALQSRERTPRDRYTDAVHSMLKGGEYTTREIAERLNLTLEQARRTCKRLERKGLIRMVETTHNGSVKVVRWGVRHA